MSKETTPEDPVQLEALKKFFSATRFEHHLLSMWLKALDPEEWKRYNDLYQRARSNGKLGILDDGDMGIRTYFSAFLCPRNAMSWGRSHSVVSTVCSMTLSPHLNTPLEKVMLTSSPAQKPATPSWSTPSQTRIETQVTSKGAGL